jgi:Tol biopolymer transport system component
VKGLFTTLVLGVTILAGCGRDSDTHALAPGVPALDAFHAAEWSAPVHLPAPINSSGVELGAQLSPDGLSIYFGSDRAGSVGVDIWAVRRECLECDWGPAVRLNINSDRSDGGPAFSPDGRTLFFSSDRIPGGQGGDDIWVTHREDTGDDQGWGTPVNLGPGVNTSDHETGPSYVPALHAEGASLYFARGGAAGSDIYRALVTIEGETIGDAVPVTELNTAATEGEPTLSHNGKEIFFHSSRSGQIDIWVATRKAPHGPWSEPINLGATINTPGGDLTPGLSEDGRTLLWSAAMSARPSLGRQDIWMSTRSPGSGDD